MKENKVDKRKRMNKTIEELERHYPKVKCFLHYRSAYELLVATQLSAQTTDVQVNKVTESLFERYPTVYDLASADLEQVEHLIKTVGLYRNKAKNIVQAARMLIGSYQGRVPSTMEELLRLPGVGRKTASVVLGNAFGIPAIAVDTHVGRIMKRMGFSEHTDPSKVEADLLELVPEQKQVVFSHQVIAHGRAVCQARNPRCDDCFLHKLCKKILHETG